MGNRDALLEGAKHCLLEKGYAHTTSRDIAAASGVSLAAIGYHFSSKEALLTEALMLVIEEWDEEFREALNRSHSSKATPLERFETTWQQLIGTFETHRRMWVANFDIFSQMDRVPEIREVLGDRLQGARVGLASLFLNIEESAVDIQAARTVGAFYHALMSGLIAQWLIDPRQATTAHDLTEAMRAITTSMQTAGKERSSKEKYHKHRSRTGVQK